MEAEQLLASAVSIAAGAVIGAGVMWWFGARDRSATTAPTLADGSVAPKAVSSSDADVVRLQLDDDGRLGSFEGPIVTLLGEQAGTGGGRALARLRLQVLRLKATEQLGPGLTEGEAIDGEAGRVSPTFEALDEGYRVTLRRLPDTRVAAEQPELQGSPEALIASVMRDAPIGVVQLDGDGRIIAHNRFFSRLAGDNRHDALVGAGFLDCIVPVDRERVSAAMQRSDRDDPVEAGLGPDGEAYVSLFLRREADGSAERSIVFAIDITQRRILETQFVQSQKMQAVGQLAGGVAHDFNNLLTAMTGFCDLLLQRHRPGDQSFADVMQIKQNANRAANLVRQLLAFSRQQTLIPRVIDVTETLADLSHLLRRLIGETVTLELVHGRDLKPVKADVGQLEQVIINLVVNGRDAMPSGGLIRMHTSLVTTVKPLRQGEEAMAPGEYVLIDVVDSGTGIPPEHLARIFEPFFTTKEVGQGTGLGLSTAFGIVKQFGGHLFVDSTVGSGTTFSVYLPAWSGELDAVVEAADGRLDSDLSGTGTVLLVEDEDPVRLFAARALRSKGYHVIEARSGEAALELLEREAPHLDLLITDVVMPGIDGPTLFKIVRESRPGLPVVCISGYSEDALRQRIVDAEGVAFLPKPFSLKQLAVAVKRTVGTSIPTS
ncbi:isocitrate dehydrogenase [alpha proteobacterium BAL199]|jgi:two-component system, cell cycle sensor histidine kinase and response regulator CckA|nr:isocitrate dehydrogenase [alpha proteobacterium BAL199]